MMATRKGEAMEVKITNHVCDVCYQEDVPVALLGPVVPRLGVCKRCLEFALDCVSHAESDAREMGTDLMQNRLAYTAEPAAVAG